MNNQQEQQEGNKPEEVYQIEHTTGWSDLRPDEVELYKNSNANIRIKPMKTPIDQLIEKFEQFKEKFDQDPLFNRVINTCIYEAKVIQEQAKDQVKTLQEQRSAEEIIRQARGYYPDQIAKMLKDGEINDTAIFVGFSDVELYANQFKSQSTQEWNEVANVNPEPSVWVACLSISNSGFINWASKGRMNNSKTWNIKGSVGMSFENATPTHWMPLPSKPTEP